MSEVYNLRGINNITIERIDNKKMKKYGFWIIDENSNNAIFISDEHLKVMVDIFTKYI